ncbi:MAG: hypothetical protein IPM92_16475 [Saprospiraceae bacterium]|nr:hypothetical protein [Saprospiraceae bacterium]
MDLSQAEAVADLIASETEASHRLAINQLKGGIRNEITELRSQLVQFQSLIELELDFSEEDVEFADRLVFKKLLNQVNKRIQELLDSFQLGNAIRTGILTVIAGKPNADAINARHMKSLVQAQYALQDAERLLVTKWRYRSVGTVNPSNEL